MTTNWRMRNIVVLEDDRGEESLRGKRAKNGSVM
jgi:hypothetical protein